MLFFVSSYVTNQMQLTDSTFVEIVRFLPFLISCTHSNNIEPLLFVFGNFAVTFSGVVALRGYIGFILTSCCS
jgi:hypothetical protein